MAERTPPDPQEQANSYKAPPALADPFCLVNNSTSRQFQFINTYGSDISPTNVSSEATPTLNSPFESVGRGRPGMSPESRYQNAAKILREGRLGPADLLLHVLCVDNPDSQRFRSGICRKGGKLEEILDALIDSREGWECLSRWIRDRGMEIVEEIVSDEMDLVKKSFAIRVADVTLDFVNAWNLESNVGFVVKRDAPILIRLLLKAAQTDAARVKNKLKRPDTLCNVVVAQLANARSSHSLSFQTMFSLFLWSTGCQCQTIDALSHCGLSLSFDSILTLVANLGLRCVELASKVAAEPHVLCWDNINISTSIFVEQRTDAPPKVQSGTFAVIYKLPRPDPSKMLLAPIVARAHTAPDLNFDLHIRPTRAQMKSTFFQMQIIVVRVLTTYSEQFKRYASVPELQHKPRRPTPLIKTEVFPLRVTTINEATVPGTIQIWHNIYEDQLKRTPIQMENIAIPSFNDQLTNARVRGAKMMRTKDLNPFLRLDNIQLGYGLFHKCLNLVWALLKIHQGAVDQLGSLKYFFALLNKTRLSNDKPDYHTLLAALMQILHGIILQAWRQECGFPTLSLFASSVPSADKLLAISQQIILKYATPMEERPKETPEKTSVPDEDLSGSSDESDHEDSDTLPIPIFDDPQADRAHRNIRLLLRDLLYVAELVKSISDGDWGRIEDMLGPLTMIFRGAGSNNYSTELLHFIRNLKLVWGDDFADIMRDCMLVNPSGLAGHWMGIDMNIEHLIGYLKTLFSSKGLYASWERLGNISAAIDHINKIKKEVAFAMRGYHSPAHQAPDTADLVWKVADNIHQYDLLIFKTDRQHHPNDATKAVVNILDEGEKKIKSSSLKTFNNNIRAFLRGRSVDEEGRCIFDELDDMSRPDFATVLAEEDE